MTLRSAAADIWMARWIIDQGDANWFRTHHMIRPPCLLARRPDTPTPRLRDHLWPGWGPDRWRRDRLISWITMTESLAATSKSSTPAPLTASTPLLVRADYATRGKKDSRGHRNWRISVGRDEPGRFWARRRFLFCRWLAEEVQLDPIRNRSQLQTGFFLISENNVRGRQNGFVADLQKGFRRRSKV